MNVIILYGIPNCDTVKAARAWLTAHGLPHQFHDFKKAGVPPQRLDAWLAAVGWETLLNRRGTTWRGLDAAAQQSAVEPVAARALMLTQPSIIKRPVVEWPAGSVTVGFAAEAWAAFAAA
jgi:Spx/MgsR family transcriptional regulator